jgi:hypothetical protein
VVSKLRPTTRNSGNGYGSKSRFIAECRHTIAQFNDPEALVRWWNCASSKASRRDFGLSYDEIEGLKSLVLQRKAQLKAAA